MNDGELSKEMFISRRKATGSYSTETFFTSTLASSLLLDPQFLSIASGNHGDTRQ